MLDSIRAASHGLHFYRRGFVLITRSGLRRFVALPLAVNTLLFVAMVSWLQRQMETLMGWLTGGSWLQWLAQFEALAWLITVIQWLLWVIFGLGVLIAVFYVFTLVANLIAAPFNGLLAERVEMHLRGGKAHEQPVDWTQFVASMPATLLNELHKFLFLAIWTVPLLVLTFIPGLNLFSSVAWFVFSAWLMAIEYTDYPMGNHKYRFRDVRKTLSAHRATALGFGASASLGQSIPLLNLVAMPAAVAGATALWVEHISNTEFETVTIPARQL